MITRARRASAWIIAAGLWPCAGLAADRVDEKLVATETADRIELTVPVSRLILSFPKGKLAAVTEERSGAQVHPRYFFYADAESKLQVSGWIESEREFDGFKTFWRKLKAAMKESGLEPVETPTPLQEGGWVGIAYDLKPAADSGVVASNIRAELLQADTWVDLHISIVTDGRAAEAREELMKFLKDIAVQEKDAGVTGRR